MFAGFAVRVFPTLVKQRTQRGKSMPPEDIVAADVRDVTLCLSFNLYSSTIPGLMESL